MAADPIQELGALYRDAAEELKKRAIQRLVRYASKPTAESFRAKLLLAEVEQILHDLDENTADWIAQNAPEFYAQGVKDTNARLRELGADMQAASASSPQIHREAVQVLVNSMQDVLEEAS